MCRELMADVTGLCIVQNSGKQVNDAQRLDRPVVPADSVINNDSPQSQLILELLTQNKILLMGKTVHEYQKHAKPFLKCW